MQVPTFHSQIAPARIPDVHIDEQGPNVGGALLPGLQAVGEVYRRARLDADRTAVTEADDRTSQWMNDRLYNPQTGALGTEGKNAVGITDQVLADFDKHTKEVIGGLNGERQQKAYQHAAFVNREQLQQQLSRHESTQQGIYQDQADKSRISTAIDSASLNYNAPDIIAAQRGTIDSVLQNQADRHGWDAETLARARREGVDQLHQGVLQRMIEGGATQDAVAYLKANQAEIDPKKSLLFQSSIRKAAADNIANGILSAYEQNIATGEKALKGLDKLGLEPAEREDVRTKIRTGLDLLYSERERQNVQALGNLNAEISTDSATLDTFRKISGLYNQGAIRPSEYESLVSRTAKSFEKAQKKAATAAEIRQLIADKIPLDPRNQDHVKAVDNAFAEDTQGLKLGEPQWQLRANAYATQTRMLPTKAVGYIREGVRSPDPNVAAQAAQFYASSKATAEEATSQLDSDSKWMAEQISTMMDAGTSAQHAVETVRANANAPKAVLDQRRKEYSSGQSALQLQNASALNNYIDKDFDPSIFTRQPDSSLRLKTAFDALSGQYYEKTGDIKLARDLAWKDMTATGVYGPTKVNGVSMIDLAPIEHFGVTRADIDKELTPLLAAHPPADGSIASDLLIVPDSLTMRQANEAATGKPIAPSYEIVTKSGDLLLDDQGVPLRYTVPTGEAASARLKDAQGKATEQARKALQEARDYRERRSNPEDPVVFQNDPTAQFFK